MSKTELISYLLNTIADCQRNIDQTLSIELHNVAVDLFNDLMEGGVDDGHYPMA